MFWFLFVLCGIVLIIGLFNSRKSASGKRTTVTNGTQKSELLRELYSTEKEYNIPCFNVIRDILEQVIKENPQEIMEFINSKNGTIREWVHSAIGNVAGNLLERGRYHVYRGVLDSTGNYLLEIYDKSYEILLGMNLKHIDANFAKSQKEILRRNISVIG
jgi:hypothetical protein